MPEITTAVDEAGATALVTFATSTMGPLAATGTASLAFFDVGYEVSATISGGVIDLRTPDVIRIVNLQVHWSAQLTLSVDPNIILPFPPLDPIVIGPVSVSDTATATADLTVDVQLVNDTWEVTAVIQGTPNLAFGAGAQGAVAALVAAVSAIPLIGPLVGILVAAIGLANVTNLLGTIVSPLLTGMRLPLPLSLPRRLALPKATPADADAFVLVDAVHVAVDGTGGEDELVVTADLSA